MSIADPVLIAKLAGAVLAFALGIWIGLGTPGMRRSSQSRPWHPSDRLRATWINRLFFRTDRPQRRFGLGRLIAPSDKSPAPTDEGGEEEAEDTRGVVRLRRTGER
jgi:hypothetical protein